MPLGCSRETLGLIGLLPTSPAPTKSQGLPTMDVMASEEFPASGYPEDSMGTSAKTVGMGKKALGQPPASIKEGNAADKDKARRAAKADGIPAVGAITSLLSRIFVAMLCAGLATYHPLPSSLSR